MIKINSFYIVYWSSCFQIIKHHWPKKNLFVKRKKLSFRRQGTLKNGSTQNALSSFGNEREIPHLNFGNNSSLIWRYINFLLPRPYSRALCDKETLLQVGHCVTKRPYHWALCDKETRPYYWTLCDKETRPYYWGLCDKETRPYYWVLCDKEIGKTLPLGAV